MGDELRLSNKGLAHLKQSEGLRLKAYDDVAGYPTIGYGHLITSEEKRTGRILGTNIAWKNGITEAQASQILRSDVEDAEGYVSSLVTVPLSQHQFDALVSFTFNVGVGNLRKSTLLRKLNSGDYSAVPFELKKWRKAGGKAHAGLVNRRKREIALWHSNEVKPAIKSRTNQGAAIAGSGALLATINEAQIIKSGADNLFGGLGEYAQWIAISVTLIGVGYVLYARRDDAQHGIK